MAEQDSTNTLVPQSDVSVLESQTEQAPNAFADSWPGRRFDARTALSAPAWIRFPMASGYSQPMQFTVRDVSPSGLDIFSLQAMQSEQVVQVRLGADSTCWSGPMRVRHCTETVGGYNIGLAALEDSDGRAERKCPQGAGSFTESAPSADMRPASLARIKAEARKTAQAYHLARVSWGLLGASIQNQVRRIIDDLSPQTPCESASGRRRQGRRSVDTGTCVVLRLPHNWRQIPARVIDVSRGGIGLLLPLSLVDDPIEREMTGEVTAQVGMTLIVGLGSEPQRLWLPGEIMHCAETKDGRVRAGIRFGTVASQQMFDK